jgi:GAF domain-containing protein
LGLAGKKNTVKPGAKLAARKRANAKSVQPKPGQRSNKRSVAHDATQAENAQLAAELRTALARQRATSDILRVISGSPTDVQPVFDAIVLTAARLLRCDRAFIQRCDSATFWTVASAGPKGRLPITQSTKAPLDPDANFPSRAIVAKKTLHLPDWSAIELPEFERHIRELHGTNSALYMPLMREEECIGLLAIIGKRANMFGNSEIALAESFRDQAVIAIENTRLFNETREALEQQTATAEVLQVINASPGVLAPVFDAIVDKAVRLCDADGGALWLVEGDVARATGGRGGNMPEPFYEYIAHQSIPVEYLLGHNAQDRPFIHTADLKELKPYQDGVPFFVANVDLGRVRTVLTVPLTEGGTIVGVFTLVRWEVRLFTDKQIALVQSFAAQAQIAMKNANLINETKDALERQTATADILKVIASSPNDVQPVFDVIVEHAVRLCGGRMGRVYRYDDGMIHMVAGQGLSVPGLSKVQEVFPRPAADDTTAGRAIQSRRPNFVTDIKTDESVPPLSRQMIEALGTRSQMTVPMLRSGEPIGAITVGWADPGAYGDQQIALLQTFADQAVIAIENVRLFNETKEALERQTATADILKVIASSPSDVQPVFEAIAERSKRLVDALSTTVFRLEDGVMHLRAFTTTNSEADATLNTMFPAPLSNFSWGEAISNGCIYRVVDTEQEIEGMRELARLRGYRSMLFVPLLRDGTPIGLIAVTRVEPGPFVEHHVQLLQTFADQAVIAIENVRLFDEVQARTDDLRESLTYQTAISNVLNVISRSPSDIQPVLDTIAETAQHLCQSEHAYIFRLDGDKYHLAAARDVRTERIEFLRNNPIAPNRGSTVGRVALERRPIHIMDALADSEYKLSMVGHGGRTILGVPLLRDGVAIGVIVLTRGIVRPFVERQIELVSTFADQALIAIENVRLFDEVQARTEDLRESLQQQTATADVLKVISRSTFDLKTVLDTLIRSAAQLCDANAGHIYLREAETYQLAACAGFSVEYEEFLKQRAIVPGRGTLIGRTAEEGGIVRIADILLDKEYDYQAAQKLGGFRTMLGIPMLRDGTPIGVLALTRSEVRPFTDKQIELVTTFADQAVIAIENVRLFDEVQARTRDLSEALTYQTGSSNILKVIASSPTDVGPVLKAIVENACELCEADDAVVHLRDGEELYYGAHHGTIPVGFERRTINRNWVTGRSVVDKAPIHLRDVLSIEGAEFPEAQQMSRRVGNLRTILSVPLLRANESIGAIVLRRTEVNPFNEKQVALLQTFADQAVIALGNVSLFDEVQAKTRDLTEALQFQTATSDVLKVISSSPDTLQPVLDVIVETSRELCGSDASTIYLLRDAKFHVAAQSGIITPHMELLRNNPQSIDQPGSVLSRVARERRTLHFPNIVDDPQMKGGIAALGGPRALLVAPLMREGQVIGAIVLRQSHLVPFTPPQIEVIETFADQAVIAISNVNLFEQVQQRTRELSKSLDDLRTAQDRLVQTEKLASLGQLTAGIAHEIKNPLNFVNNFSSLSAELVDELNDALKPAALNDTTRKEVDDLTQTLKNNLQKVVQHGKRADSIVKNMLLHSREGSGEHRPTDINALLDESLNLAYHGARAEKREFNVTLQRDFDTAAGTIEVFPQEITRVFLNLISNGFYAVTKRKAENGNSGFEPVLSAATKNLGNNVEIRIRDNGTGIPAEVKEKMFNPFFTTKPAGEGTGLGLSMSHDIIVKQHGGSIDVETEPGQFTEFRIVLPRTSIIPEKRG